MRTYIFIFALVLISSASAFKTRKSMGTVLTQIRSMMDSKGPATDVYKLIDNLVADVKQEQIDHDALRVKQQEQCSQEINFRNNEIKDANAALEASQAHQVKCESSRDNDQTNIKINVQNQKDTRDFLARIAAKRTEEAAQYQRRTKQHQESLDVIKEAEEYLDQLVTGQASLAQIGHSAGKLIRKGVEMRKIGSFAPAVQAFTQLATREGPQTYYDSDAVERVRELFEKVKNEINAAFDAYTKAEQDAIELYQTTKAQLESHLSDLIADEATLRNHLDEMNACIKQEEEVQASAAHKNDRNTGLLNDATSLCQHQEEQWERATEARSEELRVLAELRAIVQKRYAEFSSGVAHRADVNQFKEYENQSVYTTEDYEKEGGEYNERGAELAGYDRDHNLEKFL